MNKQRPVNLNLLTIKFPITAITSILHRVSGVILFLLLPFLLWMFSASLADPMSFSQLQEFLGHSVMKLLLWGMLAALLYHLLTGIRHLLMDAGFGEDLPTARLTARILLGVTIVLTLLAGVWLW